ncbi:transcriptional regulator, TetR family [Beutenbergia cavernae DSM 12333]|uniref:Transcriptional regulator, TetR family n=1 Tax=Beutenbergia cavernae (strain ATCC BAA-8 / DSM 12333 / CCUG 43141 / JCM 11478 / NBRC 16432 / NCIMB 13614 / HKI 0122) TaxID=471853 RepID=C5BX17_BEUC1|nr:TetR/AcrR family transcriptional regulator [Beutenbergia cavernae]ACQ78692.1 transcriptional regulator, TetR family [Beutenbergia cavernae DSM 12333]
MARDAGGQTVKRADARRNIEAILDAAASRLSRDPEATIAQIAQEAGVGRITLYGHFASRAELVDAVVARTIAEGDAALDEVDLTGDAREALVRLIGSSWLLIVQIGALMTVAAATLPPERMLELHAGPVSRVESLIDRGRAEGAFRTDVPSSWLAGTLHRLMHGASVEIDAGRLAPHDAAATIAATALAAFTAPGETVPSVDQASQW